jgi:VRR-NUC domain
LRNQSESVAEPISNSMSVERYRELMAAGKISWGQPPASKGAKRSGRADPGQKGRKAPRASPEEDLHRLCFQLVQALDQRHPILAYLMHVPNGGARSKGEAGKLKAMGVRKGVPDFLLPRARGRWSGLALELKSPDGRLSQDQIFWLQGLQAEGYLVSLCRTIDDFEKLLMAYLNDTPMPDCAEFGWLKIKDEK